jgi:hypothetical protein
LVSASTVVVAVEVVVPVVEAAAPSPDDRFQWAAVRKYLSPADT